MTTDAGRSWSVPWDPALVDLAVRYFDAVVAPTLGRLPEHSVRRLRDKYVESAIFSQEAVAGLRAWSDDARSQS